MLGLAQVCPFEQATWRRVSHQRRWVYEGERWRTEALLAVGVVLDVERDVGHRRGGYVGVVAILGRYIDWIAA